MDISYLDKDSIKIHSKHTTFVIDPSSIIPKTSADAVILLNGNKSITFFSRSIDSREKKNNTNPHGKPRDFEKVLDKDLSRVDDYRIVINGPGEYEINGVKVSCAKGDKGFIYGFTSDGISLILGKSSEISEISAKGGSASGRKEEIDTACQIAILNVDDGFSSSFITNLEPKIAVLYGDKKENAANLLGKGTLPATKKFTVTKDKLPEEMEVVVLG